MNINTLTIFGSAIAFLFGVWKYLDTKKLEAKNKRFEQCRRAYPFTVRRIEFDMLLPADCYASPPYKLIGHAGIPALGITAHLSR